MYRIRGVFFILLLLVIAAINLVDLVSDASHGAPVWHIVEEAIVIVLSAAGIMYLMHSLKKQADELGQISRELEAVRNKVATADRRIQDARRQYSKIITEQFTQWELTASEQQVAWLLLKGLSFREIAGLRQTREKTVRQQASDVYRKAGVQGRHAFSAWFFEDMLE